MTIGNLIAALAKAQAKFETPKKNKVAKVRSEKGSYEYRYADLADLIAAVRGPLSENELAFSHCLETLERGTLVRTILAHSSGEMLTSEYMVPHFQRQQEFGSALTYARRYALSSLLGIAADDDEDGNLADSAGPAQPRPQTNGATRTASAPPPPAPRAVNLAALPPSAEETPEVTAARQRTRMLIDKYDHLVRTAPHKHALELVMDDGREDLAEIEAAGENGKKAAAMLRDKAMKKMAMFNVETV